MRSFPTLFSPAFRALPLCFVMATKHLLAALPCCYAARRPLTSGVGLCGEGGWVGDEGVCMGALRQTESSMLRKASQRVVASSHDRTRRGEEASRPETRASRPTRPHNARQRTKRREVSNQCQQDCAGFHARSSCRIYAPHIQYVHDAGAPPLLSSLLPISKISLPRTRTTIANPIPPPAPSACASARPRPDVRPHHGLAWDLPTYSTY